MEGELYVLNSIENSFRKIIIRTVQWLTPQCISFWFIWLAASWQLPISVTTSASSEMEMGCPEETERNKENHNQAVHPLLYMCYPEYEQWKWHNLGSWCVRWWPQALQWTVFYANIAAEGHRNTAKIVDNQFSRSWGNEYSFI